MYTRENFLGPAYVCMYVERGGFDYMSFIRQDAFDKGGVRHGVRGMVPLVPLLRPPGAFVGDKLEENDLKSMGQVVDGPGGTVHNRTWSVAKRNTVILSVAGWSMVERVAKHSDG